MRRPLGRVQSASVRPSGSGRAAMYSRPLAMASTRASVRARRSRKAAVPVQVARSVALAARISAVRARSDAAMARRAPLRSASELRASTCEAWRAAWAARCRCWVGSVSMCIDWILNPYSDVAAVLFPVGSVSRSKAALQQHQIVAVDDLVPASPAKDRFDLVRAVAGDAFGVAVGVGGETTRQGLAIQATHHHGIAAFERAFHGAHAGWQERTAGGEGARGTGIDHQRSQRRQCTCDPSLAG